MAITPATILGGGATNSAASLLCGLTGVTQAGSCVIVAVFLQDNTKSVTAFNDDSTGGPMAFSLIDAQNVAGGRLELWSTAFNGGKVNASFITVTFSGATEASIRIIECTGALALGISAKTLNTTANPSIALVTQDANNYVIAAFGLVGATVPTGLTGTLRGSNPSAGANPVVASQNDNTAAGAGSVTNAITRAATTWAAIAVELRTVAGAAPPRRRFMLLGVS